MMRSVFSRGPLIIIAAGVAVLAIAAAILFKKGGEQAADIDGQERSISQPTRPPVMDEEGVSEETSQQPTAPSSEAAKEAQQEENDIAATDPIAMELRENVAATKEWLEAFKAEFPDVPWVEEYAEIYLKNVVAVQTHYASLLREDIPEEELFKRIVDFIFDLRAKTEPDLQRNSKRQDEFEREHTERALDVHDYTHTYPPPDPPPLFTEKTEPYYREKMGLGQ